jgi:uncharacterized protein YecT (DUF1311 family)
MPGRNPILPALLLCCSALAAPAQTTTPAPGANPPQNTKSPIETPPAPGNQQPKPCEANAATVDSESCYADQFKVTDLELNHLYRKTILAFEADVSDAQKRSDTSQLSFDTTALDDLKAAQAEWVKYRDLHCSAAGQQLEGGSIQPLVVDKCMILVTRHRIEELRDAYEIGGRNLE